MFKAQGMSNSQTVKFDMFDISWTSIYSYTYRCYCAVILLYTQIGINSEYTFRNVSGWKGSNSQLTDLISGSFISGMSAYIFMAMYVCARTCV